jgi:hypothetical protein
MNIQTFKHPFEHLVVDDMYTPDELCLIWRELDFLTGKMLGAEHTGTAIDASDRRLKHNKGLFLDEVYNMRHISDILSLNRRALSPEIIASAESLHPFFKGIAMTNSDTTLISYYEDDDEYGAHHDESVYSAVTFFFREPACFSGGDFHFSDFDYLVERKSNRMVLFPGFINHRVTPIKMHRSGPGLGRYSMAQFMFFR